MLRVRDELRMTLMAYQTLYESSIAFGIRKALKAEQGATLYLNCLMTYELLFRQVRDGGVHTAAGGREGKAGERGKSV